MRELKVLLLLAGAASALPALAQSVISPGALQQLRIDEEERRRQLERMEQQRAVEPKSVAPVAKPVPKADPAALRFMVREIRFSRSEILSADELRAFARDYEGREQSLADLQRMTGAINEAYRQRGVVTAQAVIPPQDVSGGIVEIRLVEGHLGSIRIEGNPSTAASYITNRLGMQSGDLIDLPGLEADLLRFNRTNDVQLKAQLLPGQAFATTDLRLDAEEPPHQVFRTFIDNGGSRGTGEMRAGATYMNRSLLGFRDDLSLSTTQSDGQQSYSVSYGIPINRWGGRLSVGYNQDYTQIRHGSFASLDITGESKSTTLSLRQPVHVAATSQLDLIAGAKSRRTDNWISEVFLSKIKTQDVSLGAEGQLLDAGGAWMANYSYTRGDAQAPSDGNAYWHGRGWLRRQQQLPNDWALIGSVSFQHTNKAQLPSSEQFLIGGEGTVRGYPVGTYAGETGYITTLELHHPLARTAFGNDMPVVANGFFFIDYGSVRPYRPPSSTLRSYEDLTSVGWGVNASLGKHLAAKVTLAYAPDKLQDPMRSRFSTLFQIVGTFF